MDEYQLIVALTQALALPIAIVACGFCVRRRVRRNDSAVLAEISKLAALIYVTRRG